MANIADKTKLILKSVADSENIRNYELIPETNALRGDGFLSEFYAGTVKDKDSPDKLIFVYIKLPPPQNVEFMSNIYGNEYHFYSTIFPKLVEFQKGRNVKNPFANIPKLYAGNVENREDEYLAFEDLRKQNFVLHDKTKFLDENQLKKIFQIYGKYHALTFSYKAQNREEYEELLRPIKPIFPEFLNHEYIHNVVRMALELGHKAVSKTDKEKAKRIETLLKDVPKFCTKGVIYKGTHSTLVHGDCWSNNMMYKYDSTGQLEDLRMIDFQLLSDSTPVHDLSYFFYAAAAKEDLEKLDEYLQVYYDSFSEFATELGSDPQKLLPFDVLKSDWINYASFGLSMALNVWQVKLLPKNKAENLAEGNSEDSQENFQGLLKEGKLESIVTDLLLSAIEYGVI